MNHKLRDKLYNHITPVDTDEIWNGMQEKKNKKRIIPFFLFGSLFDYISDLFLGSKYHRNSSRHISDISKVNISTPTNINEELLNETPIITSATLPRITKNKARKEYSKTASKIDETSEYKISKREYKTESTLQKVIESITIVNNNHLDKEQKSEDIENSAYQNYRSSTESTVRELRTQI